MKNMLYRLQESGESNYSDQASDYSVDEGHRETRRRDAEQQAAQQLERAKVSLPF